VTPFFEFQRLIDSKPEAEGAAKGRAGNTYSDEGRSYCDPPSRLAASTSACMAASPTVTAAWISAALAEAASLSTSADQAPASLISREAMAFVASV
jgi:hypothetical protein